MSPIWALLLSGQMETTPEKKARLEFAKRHLKD
jgi:hypothetical protein